MKKYIKKGLVLLLAGLIICNAFSSISVEANELSENVQTVPTEQQATESLDDSSTEISESSTSQDETNTSLSLQKIEGGGTDSQLETFSDDESNEQYAIILNGEDDKTEFVAGKSLTVYAGVRLTGTDTALENGYLNVTLPKRYLDTSYSNWKGVALGSGTNLSKTPTLTSDANNYYIRYDYNTLSGGNQIRIPFTFKFSKRPSTLVMPITIKAELHNNKDQIDTKCNEKELTIYGKSEYNFHTVDMSGNGSEKADENATKTSSNIDELKSYAFPRNSGRYNFCDWGIYMDNVESNFIPYKIKVVVKLEENVIFDELNTGNAKWTYDATTNTITRYFLREEGYSGGYSTVYLEGKGVYLKFKDWEYGVKKKAGSIEFTPVDDADNELSDRKGYNSFYVTINKIDKLKKNYYIQFNSNTQKDLYASKNKNNAHTLSFSLLNMSNFNRAVMDDDTDKILEPIKIKQFNSHINEHLYFKKLWFDFSSLSSESKETFQENEIIGATEDGTKITLGKNVTPDDLQNGIEIPKEYQSKTPEKSIRDISIQFSNAKVQSRKEYNGNFETFYLKYDVGIFEDDWDAVKDSSKSNFLGGTTPISLNTGKYGITTNVDWESEYKGYTASNNSNVTLYDYAGTTGYYVTDGGQKVHNGETFRVQAIMQPSLMFNSTIKNGKLYFIIPGGYELVENRISSLNARVNKYEVDYDFKETGKTAIVLDVDADLYSGKFYYFNIYLKATSLAVLSDSKLISYFVWDNVDELKISNQVTDKFDLNGNGKVDDSVSGANCTFNYIPTIEVVGSHKIGKSIESLNTSGISSVDIGNSFYYGMDIFNLTNDSTVKSMSLMEILPYAGDKSILADSTGAYNDRGSQYRVEITEPVKVLKNGKLVDAESEGYEILYSTDEVSSEDYSANINKNFSKTVDDWSKVTMFKISLKNGKELAKQDSVRFVVKAKVPDDKTISDEAIAKASFAYAVSENENTDFASNAYIETMSVATPVAKYQVKGNIYRDYNFDGKYNDTEQKLEGIKVGLFDDKDKKLETSMTDDQGNYSFEVISRGDYQIKVLEKPDNLVFPKKDEDYSDVFPTLPQTKSSKKARDIDEKGNTELFSLDPNNKIKEMNIGLEDRLQEIEIKKQWIGGKAATKSVDATLHSGDQEKAVTLTEKDNWKKKVVHLRENDEQGNPIEYTVSEDTHLSNYKTEIEKEQDSFIIKNINTETRTIPVTIKWIGNEGSSIEVTLQVNGKEVMKQSINSENEWKYDFTDLLKYDQISGDELKYLVDSNDIEGYTKEIVGDIDNGYVITYKQNTESKDDDSKKDPNQDKDNDEPKNDNSKNEDNPKDSIKDDINQDTNKNDNFKNNERQEKVEGNIKKDQHINQQNINKTSNKKVKTGDQTNIYIYLFMVTLTTIIGLIIFILNQRKK